MQVKRFNVVKICSIFLFSFLCLFIASKVKAEQVVIGDYVDRIYIKKYKDGYSQYLRSQWVYRASDNQFVYCIEPWVIVDDSQEYNQLWSWNESSNISEDTWNKIRLIAYYGYGYENHTDPYWYTITQVLIWRAIDPAADIYFTDTANGNKISLYEDEMTEIMKMVDNHYVIPSFAPSLYTASVNKEFELEDTNNVLSLYNIKRDSKNVVRSKIGNKLTVYSSVEGRASVDLIKKANVYTNIPFIYISANSQNVMTVGKFDDLNTNVNFQFISGSIELNKYDKDTNSNIAQKDFSLAGAEYDVYDTNGNVVATLITDSEGKATIGGLDLGKYTIKEKKASYGYKIDDTVYEVELTADNYKSIVKVYEELDRKEVIISKKYLDLENTIYLPEDNITFGFYDHNTKQLVSSTTTNNAGIATILLPYGIYIVKQNNAKDGFQKVKDFNIVIAKDTDKIEKDLVNYPLPQSDVYIYPVEKEYHETTEVQNHHYQTDNYEYETNNHYYNTENNYYDTKNNEYSIVNNKYNTFNNNYNTINNISAEPLKSNEVYIPNTGLDKSYYHPIALLFTLLITITIRKKIENENN